MTSRVKVLSTLAAENSQYRVLENRIFWSRCVFELMVSVAVLSFFVYFFLAEKIFVIKFISCPSVIYGTLSVSIAAICIGFFARILSGYWYEKKKRIFHVVCRNQHLSKQGNT